MTQDPRRTIAHLAVAVIAADGQVTGAEIAAVSHLEHLGLGSFAAAVQAEIEDVARGAPIDAAGARDDLGSLPPEVASMILSTLAGVAASDGEMQAYDPAKMIDLGPEFAVLAVQRLSGVNAAYRILASGQAAA
jgi:uncharacterized tellurite resistance protein B-like protein